VEIFLSQNGEVTEKEKTGRTKGRDGGEDGKGTWVALNALRRLKGGKNNLRAGIKWNARGKNKLTARRGKLKKTAGKETKKREPEQRLLQIALMRKRLRSGVGVQGEKKEIRVT